MVIEIRDGYSISEITDNDKAAYLEHLGEKQISDQTLMIPYPYTEEDADWWLNHLKERKSKSGKTDNWAIRDPNEKLIGGIGFKDPEPHSPHCSEIGYWLARPFWGKGLMTDVVKSVTEFGFLKMGWKRITATVFSFNGASARVLQKAGYQLEGLLRAHYLKNEKLYDAFLYAQIKDAQKSELQSKNPHIVHFKDIQSPDDAHYPNSKELLSIGSAFGKHFDLKKLGIHHEILPTGRRTSYPHAESAEEEFIYVLEGTPEVWINGNLYPLKPGDGVGFPSGTGVCHTFINNSSKTARLLVVGEKTKPENKIFYPLNPERKEDCKDFWWNDHPKQNLGPHNGKPNIRS